MKPLPRYINSNKIIVLFALLKILLHLIHPEYGFHRDELYYLAISRDFSFENLEILPLTPLYMKFITAIFGVSIKAVHLASALCGAGIIVFAGLMARELGGSSRAVFLACLTTLVSGFLIFGALMTYDSPDFLIWSACIYLLILIEKRKDPKLWVLFGLLIGLGLLNKLTILLFGTAVFLSLFTGKQIRNFRSPYIWIGGLIALMSTLPFIFWQLKTDWYYLEFIRNYAGGLAYDVDFLEYLWNQFLTNNLFNAVFWVTGIVTLLVNINFRAYRFLAFAFLILFFGCFFIGTKFYFILPYYTLMLAVGSVQIASFLEKKLSNFRRKVLAKLSLLFLYLALSSFFIPFMMPVLKADKLVNYVKLLGVDAGVKYEYTELSALPQHFADRFGWPEMTAMVADAYREIYWKTGDYPGIIADNWGQAAAISILGEEYGLPVPLCNDGWFYLQSFENHEFRSHYITVGDDSLGLSHLFSSIVRVSKFYHPLGIPHENNKIIYYCSQSKVDLERYWKIARDPDEEFVRLLREEGLDAAFDYFYSKTKNNPDSLLFTEEQINALGYEYLGEDDVDKAMALFKFNMELFPESFNVYDSYAESLMISGSNDSAIYYYKRSLELNPDNTNATDMIERISQH
jgi:hypothetical protein